MTPEEHQMLVETHELTQENSRVLKNIRRAHRYSILFRCLYWLIIITSTVGAYYFIQPYVDALRSAYSSLGVF